MTYNLFAVKPKGDKPKPNIFNIPIGKQETVKEVCCMMADFESANASMINSLINSYSINGASVTFSGESANCQLVNGIIVQRNVYEILSLTGLTCLSLGV